MGTPTAGSFSARLIFTTCPAKVSSFSLVPLSRVLREAADLARAREEAVDFAEAAFFATFFFDVFFFVLRDAVFFDVFFEGLFLRHRSGPPLPRRALRFLLDFLL